MKGDSLRGAKGTYGTQGIPAIENQPGARQSSVSWTDAYGSMWLFGGNGYGYTENSSGLLNDLWKYITLTIPFFSKFFLRR